MINWKSYLYTRSYWNSSGFYFFLKSMWTKCVFLFPFFFYLFPLNFIDAEEKNANLHKNIKNWILVIFRTCIIHKLTASCLRLSFHLTFKFLVLQTNHQFFPFFLKCKKKNSEWTLPCRFFHSEVRRSYHKILMCFSKHLDILTSWLFLILVSSLHNIVVIFIERN